MSKILPVLPVNMGGRYNELFGILMRTRNILYKLDKKQLQNIEVTPEQATILLIVENSPSPPTPSQISRQILREPHTIAVNLKRMQKKELVILEQDAQWKNRIRIKLTEKGKQIYEKAFGREFFQSVFDDFSEEEFDQLRNLLIKLMKSNMKKLKMKDANSL